MSTIKSKSARVLFFVFVSFSVISSTVSAEDAVERASEVVTSKGRPEYDDITHQPAVEWPRSGIPRKSISYDEIYWSPYQRPWQPRESYQWPSGSYQPPIPHRPLWLHAPHQPVVEWPKFGIPPKYITYDKPYWPPYQGPRKPGEPYQRPSDPYQLPISYQHLWLNAPHQPGGPEIPAPHRHGEPYVHAPRHPGGPKIPSPSQPGGPRIPAPHRHGEPYVHAPRHPGGPKIPSPFQPGGPIIPAPPQL